VRPERRSTVEAIDPRLWSVCQGRGCNRWLGDAACPAPVHNFRLHTHECPEFIYVLKGELILGGSRLSQGWASVASVGSVHSDVRSETGCVFVLVDRPL
jgi:hypothetical protein